MASTFGMGTPMRGLAIVFLSAAIVVPTAHAELYYLIVGGIGGESRYEKIFSEQTQSLAQVAEQTLGDDLRVSLIYGEEATKTALKSKLQHLAESTSASDSLAVFLVGHGSYDGEQYKFNLTGPDISDDELLELVNAVPAGEKLLVNTSSASGALVGQWTGEDRTLITATRSGGERNATRFGEYWVASLTSEEADVNKNGIITAEEAFRYTEARVAGSFESEGTLATEHAQIEGDAPERFIVARLRSLKSDTPKIQLLRDESQELEKQIDELRMKREEMGTDSYLNALQELLLELALVQRQIDEEQSVQ